MADDDTQGNEFSPTIDMATTQELFDEIKRRHECAVLVVQGRDKVDNRSGDLNILHGGWSSHCLGLVEYARLRIYGLMVKNVEDPN